MTYDKENNIKLNNNLKRIASLTLFSLRWEYAIEL